MKASARNQWSGKVASVQPGAVNAEVLVALDGGSQVVASITIDSVRRMKLSVGQDVLVLVKAPMVTLAVDLEGYVMSARNQLSGVISEIKTGAVSAAVTITLPCGDTVTASLTRESCDTLGLAIAQEATALFKSNSVVLAIRV